MLRKKIFSSIILLSFLFFFKTITAQTDTTISLTEQEKFFEQNNYVIDGFVVDDKQQPIKGALVKVLNQTTSIPVYTDGKGYYELKLAYAEIKDYTFLSYSYSGKQIEVRNIHRSAFPITLNMEMENMKCCCKPDTLKFCGDINFSFPIEQMFEDAPKPVKKKKTVRLEIVRKDDR